MGTELLPETAENHILTRPSPRKNFIAFCRRSSFKTCITVNMFSRAFGRWNWLTSSGYMGMKNTLEGIWKDAVLA